MRINKYIAACGVASRRGAESFVLEGRVKVNNKKILDLSVDIDVDNDTVTIDNEIIKPENRKVYIMLNKPKSCLTAVKDDKGRKTVMDYLGEIKNRFRLYPVGRLDYDTQGLIIITNDGELTQKLIHPSNDIPKTYIAKIEGEVKENQLNELRKGITLDGEKLRKCKITLLKKDNNTSRLEIILREGKNRQIRRMFESINKNVVFLNRIAIGDLKLGGLGRGVYRFLSDNEINYLKDN